MIQKILGFVLGLGNIGERLDISYFSIVVLLVQA